MLRDATVIALLMLVGCGGARAPAGKAGLPAPKVRFERARVYAGAGGVKVTVVDLGGGQALLRFSGVEGELAKLVIPCKTTAAINGPSYTTQIHGRKHYLLIAKTRRAGIERYMAYTQDPIRRKVEVRPDARRSEAIDVPALFAAHRRQRRSGVLARLRRFDRQAEERAELGTLRHQRDRTVKRCGITPAVAIEWTGIDDQTIQAYSVGDYCGQIFSEMRLLCRERPARRLFSGVKRVRCRLGEKVTVRRMDGEMILTIPVRGRSIQRRLRLALRGLKAGGRTLAQAIERYRTDVCQVSDRSKVIITPARRDHASLFFGSGSRYFAVKGPWNWFFDPRFFNPRNAQSFQGIDLRYYSYVRVDRKKKTCTLVCGTKKKQLTLASREQVAKVLDAARYLPSLLRIPYALARSRRGIYYYVDLGATEGAKDFRVYIGRRGRMKRQRMIDIVSDSEGAIFATKTGSLRLVIDKASATWIRRKKVEKLTWVPVRTNLPLIYNELGVYVGKPLGVPCDDF